MGRSFDRAVKAQLTEGQGGDRFGLQEGAVPLLQAALARDLKARDARDSVLAALRLAAAFDGALTSPGLAATLRGLLQSSPEAVALIRETQGPGNSLDATRRFVLGEGRTVALKAPAVDGPSPRGGLPLRALFDLHQERPRGLGRKG